MTEPQGQEYSLANLLGRLGEASDELLEAHFADIDRTRLVSWGAEVATTRIGRDGPRIVGAAADFLDHATDEQAELLATVSPASLKLTLWAVKRAVDLNAQRKAHQDATASRSAERAAMSDAERAKAISWRDILRGVVAAVAGTAEPFATRIKAAYSRAEDDGSLAASLSSLAQIGHELLADKGPAIVARRKGTRLSKAWLARAEELASRAGESRDAAEGSAARPAVEQSLVDLHDGYALWLLEEILGAFDRANAADPTIPRLPVYTLRNVLRPPTGQKKKADTPQPA